MTYNPFRRAVQEFVARALGVSPESVVVRDCKLAGWDYSVDVRSLRR